MKIEPSMKPLLLSAALLWVVPAFAQNTEGSLQTGASGDWLIHQNAGDGPKICFAATQPKIKEPAAANRSRVVLYVSAWPKDGVKSEVSIKFGYPVNQNTPVTATVDDTAFKLFADEDRGYVADGAEEAKLVDAMKAGTRMVVKAQSTRGTETTDTYSLNGFGKALDAIASACQ